MSVVSKAIRRLSRRIVAPHLPPAPETMISKIARFTACEMVAGDYVEFGVYDGSSFCAAYHAFRAQFADRIQQTFGGSNEEQTREERRRIWTDMRFVAVDSFKGLPPLTAEDKGTADFEEAQFAYDLGRFRTKVASLGLDMDRLITIEGWFEDVYAQNLLAQKGVTKAAVVWIDGDLYSSAKSALNCATPLLQDGTVLVFDDWFSYRGHPRRGEQRAFHEWTQTPAIQDRFTFQEFQRETWKRMSFIASSVSPEHH